MECHEKDDDEQKHVSCYIRRWRNNEEFHEQGDDEEAALGFSISETTASSKYEKHRLRI